MLPGQDSQDCAFLQAGQIEPYKMRIIQVITLYTQTSKNSQPKWQPPQSSNNNLNFKLPFYKKINI